MSCDVSSKMEHSAVTAALVILLHQPLLHQPLSGLLQQCMGAAAEVSVQTAAV